jgi:hypothetical protein
MFWIIIYEYNSIIYLTITLRVSIASAKNINTLRINLQIYLLYK